MPSITLDQGFLNFIQEYLEKHGMQRIKEGKGTTKISVIREALVLWAEKNELLEQLEKHLKNTKLTS